MSQDDQGRRRRAAEFYEDPKCLGRGELFYGPDVSEADKELREKECKSICYTCSYRLPCLEASIRERHEWGVWGGMGESERRLFINFMLRKGYTRKPTRKRLRQAMKQFYQAKRAKQQQERQAG